MKIKVDNAIIMAAGTSSRFAPLSFEKPKALIEVNGEIMIERLIKQLIEAGIKEIILVVGYKKELFYYLKEKFNITLIENTYYNTRNNNASIYVAKNYLKNTYICSADNYYLVNPFSSYEEYPYYSAVYINGPTNEWCITEDVDGFINSVIIGGNNQWVMLGHAFWNKKFSDNFIKILTKIFNLPSTYPLYWENIYSENLNTLKLKLKKYNINSIQEFDTLDELRMFDHSYINDTRSQILKIISEKLNCHESQLSNFKPTYNESNEANGFVFNLESDEYSFDYSTGIIKGVYK